MHKRRWRRFLPKRPRFLATELETIFTHANTKLARFTGMSFEQLDKRFSSRRKMMDDMDVSRLADADYHAGTASRTCAGDHEGISARLS